MQMELEEESRKYVTINTHQGLYQFTPYGIVTLNVSGVYFGGLELSFHSSSKIIF